MTLFARNLIQSTLLSLLIIGNSLAATVVVVSPSVSAPLSDMDVKQLFLGKTKTFSDGMPAIPVNQKIGSKPREHLLRNLLNITENQYRSYWTRRLFTGAGVPPKEVDSDQQVIKLIEENPDIVGYIDAENVTNTVKVVLTIE